MITWVGEILGDTGGFSPERELPRLGEKWKTEAVGTNTSPVEKRKSAGNMAKEEEGFECVSFADDQDYVAYLTPLGRHKSSVMFNNAQDVAFVQMPSTKNAKHVNNG
ncbi:hypothetical protein Lal_00001261 [Lupinus albus]|nr:hypothetical protein Lal_00001261 [Lupinus albus]